MKDTGRRMSEEHTLSLRCAGSYEGSYPEWSQRLVHELTLLAGVTRVEWQDKE